MRCRESGARTNSTTVSGSLAQSDERKDDGAANKKHKAPLRPAVALNNQPGARQSNRRFSFSFASPRRTDRAPERAPHDSSYLWATNRGSAEDGRIAWAARILAIRQARSNTRERAETRAGCKAKDSTCAPSERRKERTESRRFPGKKISQTHARASPDSYFRIDRSSTPRGKT